MELAWDLLSHAVRASEILGVDEERRARWKEILDHLPPLGIGGTLANLVAMLVGLILALVSSFAGHGAVLRPALSMFRKKDTWLMMVLVIGIQAFSAALLCPLDAAGGTLVTGMRDELVRTGIPLVTIIMVIPFISGMVTQPKAGPRYPNVLASYLP